jgi:hypothetical protein
MGGFLNGLKTLGQNLLTQPIPGTQMWGTQQAVGLEKRQQQLAEQEEMRREQAADTEFHQKMVGMGAKPVVNGLVEDSMDVPGTPDVSIDSGDGSMPFTRPGAAPGQSLRVVRKADPANTVKWRDATGDQVSYELPSVSQQLMNQFQAQNNPDLIAQKRQLATGQASFDAWLDQFNRSLRGVSINDVFSPDEIKKLGLNPNSNFKFLPGELTTLTQKTAAPTIQAQNRSDIAAGNNQTRRAIAGMQIQSREDIANQRTAFEQQKAARDQALRDAISARSAAVQSGANPNLARIQLPAFNNDAQRYMGNYATADNIQRQIFDAQSLLNPDEIPDGQTFTDPFSGAPRVMNADVRQGIQDRIADNQRLMNLHRQIADNGMQRLGVAPAAAQPGTGAPGGPATPGNPQGSGAARPAGGTGGGQASGAALTPEAAAAQDLYNRRISPSQLMSQIGGRGMQKTAYVNRVKGELRKIDPNFSWEDAESSYNLAKSPQFQQTIRYMDYAGSTLANLVNNANILNNGNVRSINALLNAGKSQFNNVDLKRFQTDKIEASDAIAKILQGGTGSGTSDKKLEQAESIFRDSDSPASIAAAAGEIKSLLGNRRQFLVKGTPYESQGAPTVPQVASKADFDRLPSGTLYLNVKDGQQYKKP